MAGSGESVKVVVRARPINQRETGLGCKVILSMVPSCGQCSITNPHDPSAGEKTFTFDGAYNMDSATESIYNEIVFPLVENCLQGYNGTVFAYGQTGSGKSFSMQGPDGIPAQKGIIPRTFEHIFEATAAAENTKFLVHASYLEIYNEEVRDLLGENTKLRHEIKEHPERGVYVAGLSMHAVHSVKDCQGLMDTGLKTRATASTAMNADSSRSHSIFTLSIEMMETLADGEDHIRTAKLNLVDLAGSERQAKTMAEGDRLKEGAKINLSLSALGNVISALVDGKIKHIPYRDSKLTRLLQDSLGGNTKTIMIACMSPADNNYDETISTLRYANRAKNIKNKPRINEDPKDALLREYAEEIQRLKSMLGPGAGDAGSGDYQANVEAEKERLKQEYENQIRELKNEFQTEKSSKAQLQDELANLKNNYEQAVKTVQKTGAKVEFDHNGVVAPQSSPRNGSGTVDPNEALKRLELLQQQMVGGEESSNKQLKEKRAEKMQNAEKRKKQLADALMKVDGDDPMMKVYSNIQDKLEAVSKQLEKEKRKAHSFRAEIQDIQSEFELDRIDYLETIRRQDQQLRLLQQILDKVQPTLRRDCNYFNIDRIKKEAIWDEDLQKWYLPEMSAGKTQLPGGINPGGAPVNGYDVGPRAIPRNENDDQRLRMKLLQSEAEDIAGNYFKSSGVDRVVNSFENDKRRQDNNRSHFPMQKQTWEGLLNGVIYTNDIYEKRPSPLKAQPQARTVMNNSNTSKSVNVSVKKPPRLDALDNPRVRSAAKPLSRVKKSVK